ncbi:MAG: IS630 transposase-related protein [Pseudomonadota bacterium]|nr:IS630 transposase-related protein [Pseudomonadota bacterium]
MTYSLDYRKQVLKSLNKGMSFAEAAVFYDISPTTIQKWKKRLHSKTTRDITPDKIEDEALAQDVKDHPDDYHYERAQRFNCSPTGIKKR